MKAKIVIMEKIIKGKEHLEYLSNIKKLAETITVPTGIDVKISIKKHMPKKNFGNVEVVYQHGRRKTGIIQLSNNDAYLMFGPRRQMITVEEHFRRRYNVELRHPKLRLFHFTNETQAKSPVETPFFLNHKKSSFLTFFNCFFNTFKQIKFIFSFLNLKKNTVHSLLS
ncbi:PAZ domain-containing protein [Caenorhabditis elegans]|uniref:PAZ domain-containing protein n=1 Tax=Caenorhabditis elegans TaxID=6239 RepID=Q9XUY9_CAEEL|nr:PAZ domain-containing protein [Caenorhabditis elegans]CAB04473.1 PAZ domain-containing protein [Caenorhabditis elegans]|eukprot:NP_507752.1 Uncharacterized protein CELE_F55C9.3 [Caenorhabditis elegans]